MAKYKYFWPGYITDEERPFLNMKLESDTTSVTIELKNICGKKY